jgi:hypothetical protein
MDVNSCSSRQQQARIQEEGLVRFQTPCNLEVATLKLCITHPGQ